MSERTGPWLWKWLWYCCLCWKFHAPIHPAKLLTKYYFCWFCSYNLFHRFTQYEISYRKGATCVVAKLWFRLATQRCRRSECMRALLISVMLMVEAEGFLWRKPVEKEDLGIMRSGEPSTRLMILSSWFYRNNNCYNGSIVFPDRLTFTLCINQALMRLTV